MITLPLEQRSPNSPSGLSKSSRCSSVCFDGTAVADGSTPRACAVWVVTELQRALKPRTHTSRRVSVSSTGAVAPPWLAKFSVRLARRRCTFITLLLRNKCEPRPCTRRRRIAIHFDSQTQPNRTFTNLLWFSMTEEHSTRSKPYRSR
jgi:hypothetical protein